MKPFNVMRLRSAGPGAPVYTLTSASYSDFATQPTDARCTWRIESDGTVDIVNQADFLSNSTYDWIAPKPPGATHYVRVTPTTGTFSGGSATGTWLAITTTQSWNVLFTANSGSKSCTFTVDISTNSGGTNIVKTATGIVITATVDPGF